MAKIERSQADDHRRGLRTEQEARRARRVIRLLDTRSELRGVNPVADFLDESVRWTA